MTRVNRPGAFVEAEAATAEGSIEQHSHVFGTVYQRFYLRDLVPRESFPAGRHGHRLFKPLKQSTNLGDGEACFLCESDQGQQIEDTRIVSAPAADPAWLRQQAGLLVIPNGGGPDSGAVRDLSYRQITHDFSLLT
jgi:hypothetical protein